MAYLGRAVAFYVVYEWFSWWSKKTMERYQLAKKAKKKEKLLSVFDEAVESYCGKIVGKNARGCESKPLDLILFQIDIMKNNEFSELRTEIERRL